MPFQICFSSSLSLFYFMKDALPFIVPPHSTLNIEAEGKPEAHRGASEAPAQDQNQVPGAGIL
jgi:hypothetical protein